MKIALLNLANNITDMKTVSSGETIYLKKTIELLGHEVDIISKSKGQYAIAFEDVKDINDYDRLLVINGAINFFGGKENPIITNNFKLMAKYKNRIDYLLTDLRLPFKQLWPSIEKRDWGYQREEVWVNSPIRVITQTHNLEITQKIMPDHEAVYFPLERYILLFPQNQFVSPFKMVDLIYGGSFRAGNRQKKMIEYFFDTDYSVEFYGSAKESQFNMPFTKPPLFTSKIPMNETISKNSEGYASIIIGDDNYNNNMLTLRVWETMMSEAVCLIDHDFDPQHKIMEDDWYYVRNKEDVARKIGEIKGNENSREIFLEHQHRRIYELFNKEEFLQRLEEIL